MHLYRRNGRYYFRYVLPKLLAERIQATEIRFSLFTYNKNYAALLANYHHSKCLQLASTSFSSVQQVSDYVKAINPSVSRTLVDLIGSADVANLQDALRLLSAHDVTFYVTVDPAKARYVESVGTGNVTILLPEAPTHIKIPYFEGEKIIIELLKANEFSLRWSLQQTIYLHQVWVKDVPEETLSALLQTSALKRVKEAPVQNTEPSPTLSEELLPFLELNKPPRLRKKTFDEYEDILSLFIEIVGDKKIKELTNKDYDKFSLILRDLPPNREKSAKTKGKSIEELLKLKLKPMTEGTAYKYHARVSTFFNWLTRRHGPLRIHPESPIPKSQIKREKILPFTSHHLKQIFESSAALEIFKNCENPWQFWLPVMGIHTGARLNEMAQLRLENIVEVDGISCISICEDEEKDQRTKSANSIRTIPIHPRLIDLGFLKFVENKRSNNLKGGRLFQLTYYEDQGYIKEPSDWWNSQFLTKLGIKSRSYNFHSLRHAVSGRLNRSKVGDWRISKYMGHELPKHAIESQRSYMNETNVNDLLPVLDELKYEIDWTGYKEISRKFL